MIEVLIYVVQILLKVFVFVEKRDLYRINIHVETAMLLGGIGINRAIT